MSTFTGDMWSRWVGVNRTCRMTFVHVLELLPALQNCLAPREQELITFKGFSWWLYSFSCLGGLFDFSQNLVSRYSEKIFLLVFKLE